MAKARRLPSGKWRVQVYWYTDSNGKIHRKSFTSTLKKDAERRAAAFILSGRGRDEMGSRKLDDAYTAYIESKRNLLSPTTIKFYESMQRNQFQDLLQKKVSALTQIDIQKAVNEEAETLSPKTVRSAYGLLVAVLKVYRPDFTPNATLPRNVRKTVKIPTNDEIKRIYDVVKGSLMELPFLLASQCGLREGEICGLTRDCVLDDRIVVRNNMVYGEHNRWQIRAPKTDAGNREIFCSAQLIKKLRNATRYRKDVLPQYDIVLGLTCHYVSHYWYSSVFPKLDPPIEKFPFHALRHYFASQALLQGVPKFYLVEIMGHSSSQMIDRVYGHTFPDVKKAMSQKLINLTDELL